MLSAIAERGVSRRGLLCLACLPLCVCVCVPLYASAIDTVCPLLHMPLAALAQHTNSNNNDGGGGGRCVALLG